MPKPNFWFIPEVWEERNTPRALKHDKENHPNDMVKCQRWKDQERKLTNLYKKVKYDEHKGKQNTVIT